MTRKETTVDQAKLIAQLKSDLERANRALDAEKNMRIAERFLSELGGINPEREAALFADGDEPTRESVQELLKSSPELARQTKSNERNKSSFALDMRRYTTEPGYRDDIIRTARTPRGDEAA
jgi:hypothetical protein